MTATDGATGNDVDDLWLSQTSDGHDGSHVTITSGQNQSVGEPAGAKSSLPLKKALVVGRPGDCGEGVIIERQKAVAEQRLGEEFVFW